jgi:hypothetical protein
MSGRAKATALLVGAIIGALAGLGAFFALVGAAAAILLTPVHGWRVLLTGVPAYLATGIYLAQTDSVPDWGRGIQSMDTIGFHAFPSSEWRMVACSAVLGIAGWCVTRLSERKRRAGTGATTR